MIHIEKKVIILSETEYEFENDGVLNPAIYQEGNTVHVFYRAVRQGNFSTIGYAKLQGPTTVIQRNTQPLIVPETEASKHGIEDPRIVKIDDTFYLNYCSYDGYNALGSVAISTDLIHFKQLGIMVPQISIDDFCTILQKNKSIEERYIYFLGEEYDKRNANRERILWDKNVLFFPKKINGKFTFLHRIRPEIQIASVTQLSELNPEFWNTYMDSFEDQIFMKSKYPHESDYIGGGCPPIETKAGWLIIYHGVEQRKEDFIYSACAALFDLEDPQKEIARLPYALISPETEWEIKGYVNNVVFPTGTAIFDEMLYIYYGAADKRIAVASVNLKDLISELLKYKDI